VIVSLSGSMGCARAFSAPLPAARAASPSLSAGEQRGGPLCSFSPPAASPRCITAVRGVRLSVSLSRRAAVCLWVLLARSICSVSLCLALCCPPEPSLLG
jgi:hypothetical protein